ncbi:hypothetical protein ACRYCC_26190 [Actinomadura scrupuli]|uniref:hypothetical protein n=1 Tax=Actinomadura scrupuli TaxID=559629 RepID=UPI003D974DA9
MVVMGRLPVYMRIGQSTEREVGWINLRVEQGPLDQARGKVVGIAALRHLADLLEAEDTGRVRRWMRRWRVHPPELAAYVLLLVAVLAPPAVVDLLQMAVAVLVPVLVVAFGVRLVRSGWRRYRRG